MRHKDGDINRLRTWGRRPSCAIRYDHGGYNASFPMNDHTVIGQLFSDLAKEQEEARRKRLNPYPRRSNILHFPGRKRQADII